MLFDHCNVEALSADLYSAVKMHLWLKPYIIYHFCPRPKARGFLCPGSCLTNRNPKITSAYAIDEKTTTTLLKINQINTMELIVDRLSMQTRVNGIVITPGNKKATTTLFTFKEL